jgi:hypothetical protein
LKVVGGIAFRVFGVDAHVIVQEAVKAEVFEANLLLDHKELLLPVCSEAFVGAACTDGHKWGCGVWAGDARGVYLDLALPDGLGCGLSRKWCDQQGCCKSEGAWAQNHDGFGLLVSACVS